MNDKLSPSLTETTEDQIGAPIPSPAQTRPVRGWWGRFLLLGLGFVIATLVGITLTRSKNPRQVPARVFVTSLIGFRHPTPGPWPAGNDFSLASRTTRTLQNLHGPIGEFVRECAPNFLTGAGHGWAVVNMHAENFSEIVRRRNLETVAIVVLDKNNCLIVDARIPREWFRQKPEVVIWPSTAERVMAAYPDKFSLPPDVSMIP